MRRVVALLIALACLCAPNAALGAGAAAGGDSDLSGMAKAIASQQRLVRGRHLAPACTMYLRICNVYSPTEWLIATDVDECVTGVYRWGDGAWRLWHEWPCTPGAPATPTRLGVYNIADRAEVSYSLDFEDMFFYYVQYSGYYLFHSVTYYPGGGVKDARLGYHLSHGCVRLATENAQWLYENIPSGTLVYLY